MRRFSLILFLLLGIFEAAFSQPDTHHTIKAPIEKMTLEQSLQRAERNNPELLESEKEVAVTRAESGQAKSLFYPKFNFNMNYVRYRNETLGLTAPELGSVLLEAPIPNPSGSRPNPLAENLFLSRLGFVQTLFSGGRIRTTYKLAQANIRRAESDLESLRRQVEFDTVKSFGSLLALQLEESELKKTQGTVDALLKKYPNGGEQKQLLRKRASLREQTSTVVQNKRKAQFDYLRSMGMEYFNQVEVDGTLNGPALTLDLQTLLAWAKEKRSDLKLTQVEEELDQLSVRLSLSDRYPVFLLGGGFEIRDTETNVDESNWNTVLSVNIPIFDGFSSLYRIRESRYRAEKGRLHRVRLEDQIEADVRSSYLDVLHWEEILASRLEDSTDADRMKSSGGVPDQLDVLSWKLSTRLAVIEAQLNRYLSYASLERAVGRHLTE